jgi:SpoVK/Ycf46/Vps4 family AAA+-type ATPase
MFNQIRGLLQDSDGFVLLLIDEIESLAAARRSAMSGSEPSDVQRRHWLHSLTTYQSLVQAIRVVNAFLTQLDSLKEYKNVLVMATSNITNAIDDAFVDRADMKVYIGFPSTGARYHILKSAMEELMRVRLIEPKQCILDYQAALLFAQQLSCNTVTSVGVELLRIVRNCEGLSGRTLRKLPFLAYALFVRTRAACALDDFMQALRSAVAMAKSGSAAGQVSSQTTTVMV